MIVDKDATANLIPYAGMLGKGLQDVSGFIELYTQSGCTLDGKSDNEQWNCGAYDHTEYLCVKPN
ncbi:hypothetical protein DIJ64_00910 [Mycobacterium leprae]|uniref:Uncharacterized protein n=1 Tax=Mycobacterium leprae TaxID=1769 RepID=A0AAD0KSL4_MYCLR|nr:hypothetical protein [Mycobacterium leprae]AWV47163.1 hypothetical protein DIJ64_00910 [Mycobacterium leprae]OAR20660.1 hypothetical protein A8144_09990 [Mycobacterium leprae 3125609]OAX70875.1 hypothetical protein A3216_09480 [Mycobacterium leprae 7935681]